MRVWIDISNSPQVPFFRPLIALLRERGHEVEVTTRGYAQTVELLELHGIAHEVVGPGTAAHAVGKARAMAGRLRALDACAKRRFDLALSHASHELPLVARSLGIPSAYAFDYELARVAARARLPGGDARGRPRGDPAGAARPLGARAAKVRRYPGLKEEYYLHGFEPDDAVLDALGLDRERIARRRAHAAPDVSLYHRPRQPALRGRPRAARTRRSVHARRPPRTAEQRDAIRGSRLRRSSSRARDRRAEPRRALRPRRLGGRHDEPRGGRARRSRLHDVCGSARRGRRAPRERGRLRP